MTGLNKIILAIWVLLLTGCANQSPQQMYRWDNYQDTVYQYYTNDSSPQEQVDMLQKLIEKARTSAK